jgi:hypothetical protein
MQSPVFVLSTLVGIVVGMIYVFHDNRSKSSDDLAKNPRYTNLKVVLAAGLLGYIVDWQGLARLTGQTTEIQRVEIALYYGISAVSTITILLAAGALFVGLETARRNRHVPERARVAPWGAIALYVARGYSAYEERVTRIDRELASERQGNSVLRVVQTIRLAILAEQGFRRSRQNREAMASQVLDLIIEAVVAQLPEARNSVQSANYMRAIPYENLSEDGVGNLRFGEIPSSEYSHILVLEQYSAGHVGDKLALAVHKNDQHCLPGAPLAFRRNVVEPVVASRVKFAPGVPRALQAQGRQYFKSVKFRSCLSIPMQKGDKIVGVVNVEAEDEIFDPRDPRVKEVGESLHSHCMSLAYLISEDEDQR